MDAKPGLVLIHGAGLGSWIWEDVAPLLESPWLPLDFPERQRGPVPKKYSLEEYTRHLLRRILSWDQPKLVLVAHSIGGVPALQLANRLGSRVVGIVAVGAAIPARGGSYFSCIPFPKRLALRSVLRVAGTRPTAAMIRKGLGSDLELLQADKVVKRYTPEALRLYTDRCGAEVPNLESMYIRLSRDKAFPPALQEKMARNLRARKILTLASGHLPMLSRPREFAAVLNGFMADLGQEADQVLTEFKR